MHWRGRATVYVWILIAALVFRAMPHVTLVSGYLLPFFELNIWGFLPTTIIVLVAINQPFTLWMLHSFFLSIPRISTRAPWSTGARDSRRFAWWIPVMWPGVVTTGLFSFLLAYNDFTVTAMLLTQDNQTMAPKIASFPDRRPRQGDVCRCRGRLRHHALFVLVLFFQTADRQG